MSLVRLVLLLAIVAMTSAAYGEDPAVTDPPRPNVLLIAVDDLNDWVGFLDGYSGVKTPNLDRLAKRGMVFTRAYCSAPACNPSRASLLSGRRPSTSGVYHNNQPWRGPLADAVTLPKHLMDQGYLAAGGGKIFHNGMNDIKSWTTYYNVGGAPSPPNRPVNGIPRAAQFDWGPVDAPDERMADYKLMTWAAEVLGKKHDQPFFLAVGLTKPHLPWYVPKKYFELYPLEKIRLPEVKAGDLDDVPALGREMAGPDGDHRSVVEGKQWAKAVQAYLAAISFADAQIGRLLDSLDKSPHAENTIIVMFGDHGWHLGQKQHWRKFALWEEATRVPLIVVAPGITKPESRCERTVSLLDLYPTLVELCGVSAPKRLEGASFRRLLSDPKADWDRPAVTTHGRDTHAVRSERWRYIRYQDGSEELYDHDSDPREWTNLAGDKTHSGVKAELSRWLPKTNAADAPSARPANPAKNKR